MIPQVIFDELSALYSERSRVVHRYIISDITTEQVFRIAHRYEQVVPKVNEAIWLLEDKQVRLGVGMVRRDESTGDSEEIRRMAEKEHAAEWLARAMAKRAT